VAELCRKEGLNQPLLHVIKEFLEAGKKRWRYRPGSDQRRNQELAGTVAGKASVEVSALPPPRDRDPDPTLN
jgi:hypothetical protein